jgi:heme/copper-type cytochrome/quinol oxidase subunit 2
MAAEFGTGQVVWSFLWFVLFFVWLVILVLAPLSVWRYVGRSTTSTGSRVLLTGLGILGLLFLAGTIIGIPAVIAVVFFERTSAKKLGPPGGQLPPPVPPA